MNAYLWRSKHTGAKYREISRFMNLSSNQLGNVPLTEMVLLFQWILEQQNIVTNRVSVDAAKESFDLDLINKNEGGRREYARYYKDPPIGVVYKITTDLKGQNVKLIHLFTIGTFCHADHKAQNGFPLFLALKERSEIIHLLQEAKETYQCKLNAHKGTAWSGIERFRYRFLKLRAKIKKFFFS